MGILKLCKETLKGLTLYVRHNHIIELLRPVGVEVCHLEPVGLVLNADIAQLNEYLGRLDVIVTVPLERRAKRRFDFCFVHVQTVEA